MIHKTMPHINSVGSATIITWPDTSYAMYYADTWPQEIHYANGEWIKIVDRQVVEVHTLEDIEAHAHDVAMHYHGAQTYGDGFYIEHLEAVRQVLSDFSITGNAAIAAWLHDTVEDTTMSIDTVKQLFGFNVANYVWAVSGIGKNRPERNAAVYEKLAAFPAAVALKLADRIANTENAAANSSKMLALYRKEYPAFRDALFPLNDKLGDMWARLDKASI
jgi:(p)ppGpp synthase/HD superfamily hydrolase